MGERSGNIDGNIAPGLDLPGFNIRDLGGIPIASIDGEPRCVKPGLLIRSCALATLGEDNVRALGQQLHPTLVIDLRITDEVRRKPDPMQLLPGTRYEHVPLTLDGAVGIIRKGNPLETLSLLRFMAKDPAGLMRRTYAEMVTGEFSQRALSRLFDLVLEAASEERPHHPCVLWHCTAGKDRAGLFTAILLLALGASPDSVRADYLRTNAFMGPYIEEQSQQFRRIPKSIESSLGVMNSADESFLAAALRAIDEQCGGFDRFLQEKVGLNEEKQRLLREVCTVPRD